MPDRLLFRFLPRSLIARVYALYSVALLLFVGLGLGLFYRYQFDQQVEESYRSASMLIEVASQVVGESAVIGDYDTIRRTLDNAIQSSQFAAAAFIDLQGGSVRSENRGLGQGDAPAWLVAKVADDLPDINRNLVVGGRDYGVLRLRFAWATLADELWRLIGVALLLAGGSLFGGLLLIWFPLRRWLGSLENADRFRLQSATALDAAAREQMIDEVPLEFRPLFVQLAQTSETLGRELASREKAIASLRGVVETMVPDKVIEAAGGDDIEQLTRIICQLVVEREAGRVELDNQKFALDQHAIVSITDRSGCILYANDRFCSSSGYDRDELIGQTHALLRSGVHPPAFFQRLWDEVLAGKVWQGEICNRARDGRLLWYASTIVPLATPGCPPDQFIGISTDITERKRAEAEAVAARAAAEQANVAKSQFLANMSHEIRTPMNGIIGMAELALGTELTDEQHDYLTLVKSSADSLLGIINDILDFSKIEAGKMTIEAIPFDLRQTLDETVRSLRLRAEQKGLALHLSVDSAVPAGIEGDPGRLRQVLVNLIGNAIKFTDQGEVDLSVVIERGDDDRSQLHFAVRDTGIGISPDKQGQIFEAFAQEDASTTRRYGGTGLGLSISSRLVELMGGRMWLDSTPGQGSTFHFSLACQIPAEVDDQAEAGSGSARRESEVPAPVLPETVNPAQRILLVEDNAINQRVALALLQRRGYRAEVAANGEEALAATATGAFALILMDMQMPVMDGLQATAQIRQREAAQGVDPVPIIAMTANAMEGDRERCLAAGMNDYLSKPINSGQLYAVLDCWLAPADGAKSGDADGN